MLVSPEKKKSIYTEDDWSDMELLGTYEKSKVLAEKAAWDFVNNLPEESKF